MHSDTEKKPLTSSEKTQGQISVRIDLGSHWVHVSSEHKMANIWL